MKWILICAAAFAMPLMGATAKKNQQPEPPPFDADLFKKDDQIMSGSLEFLFWVATEGGLDFAQKMKHPAPSTTFAQGHYESATYSAEPGFRIGLLYFRAPRFWEVRGQYTRLTGRGEDEVKAPAASNEFVTGTWPQITSNPLTLAKSHIHLNYNVFDLLIDRYFIPNPHLRLRILGGTTCAWIAQDWKINYYNATSNATTIRNQWHFVGAGLKSGTMVDWYWGNNIYVTGLGMVGLLMGNYTNHSKQTAPTQPLPVRDTSFHDARPTFTSQMSFGPSWQKNFKNNRVEIFLGGEMNVWFNLQEIYRSTSGAPSDAKETWINSGVLALYGLTSRVTVDF